MRARPSRISVIKRGIAQNAFLQAILLHYMDGKSLAHEEGKRKLRFILLI